MAPPSAAAGAADQVSEAAAGGMGGDAVDGAEAGAPTPGLSLVGGGLPTAQLGRDYEHTFQAQGVENGVEYAVLGDSLPAGLTLSRTGVLSGIPSQAGIFTLSLEATADGASADAEYQLEVVKNAWLVYRSDDRTPAVNELFAVNAGTQPPHAAVAISHALAKGEQISRDVAWSPDGSFVAYASEGVDTSDVYLVDMRGLVPAAPVSVSATLKDVHLGGYVYVTWAPDGKALLLDGAVETFVVELEEALPVRARAIPVDSSCWEWTADSQTLLCRNAAQTAVFALQRDSNTLKILTGGLAISYGTLTPDGTKLIFEDDENGALYFSRFNDPAPRPIQIGRVPLSGRVAEGWPTNDAVVYVASNVSVGEHEIYRASLTEPPTVETLVSGIDTSATGMDYRDIDASMLPGGKLLTYRSKGRDEGTSDIRVRALASGRQTSISVRSTSHISLSDDGSFALVPELSRGGDYLERCNVDDDGLQRCVGLNNEQAGFEIAFAQMSPNNNGALFIGGLSGQPRTAFYSDMRGDIRQAVPLNDDGYESLVSYRPFSSDGSKIGLSLVSGNTTSLYLVDVSQQRPGAPEKVSGKGLLTSWAWQPR
ncbi:MAG: putative Ig domain-containing protein [Myxococcales bacterium]